ncbi:type IX secretion system membrane protein PorP/SprF [uncultured Kriegella sp.]|uniref:PorP/SprF family type IX secretion system membrane protein n=1 Tax=uncultured Kriegella sp. TaxID=1798910 RepID=UPI0030D9EEFD|tara:strand:+ start:232024 stop:233712 length:1689 start_codon:yes stop_codon:yes gene_type:complete
MNSNKAKTKKCLLLMFFVALSIQTTYSQEVNPAPSSSNSYHNQLFFNRFLINPTFSLVRENKSYLNILNRNQYATFEDNYQNYYVGFSNKLNDHTAVGIGVYSQWSGVIQQFGFNANYATSVKLSDKSKLTFGTNVTYFNEGLDKNRVTGAEDDPAIQEATKESKLAIQPGITLSTGKFDFGLYAQDLFKYNQSTDDFTTSLNDKSIKASVQYTHSFMATRGLFANGRLMPLVQIGRNEDSSLSYVGALLLDLPKYGWVQTTLDDQFGMSAGFGFNLSKKMSLGYLMEKDLSEGDVDLGWNHELTLAYTFKDNSGVGAFAATSNDDKIDRIVRNYEEQILQLMEEKNKSDNNEGKKEIERMVEEEEKEVEYDANSLAYQNRMILDELILRQDSIESARKKELAEGFEAIVEILRKDIKENFKAASENYRVPENTVLAQTETTPVKEVNSSISDQKSYVKLPIKVLNQSDIIGVESGYYVIANVYKNKKYLDAFMHSLNEQGLDAKQFYNKENGLHYVYLADFNFKEDAETAFVSNLDGKYRDEKWIMQVDNSMATAANIYED